MISAEVSIPLSEVQAPETTWEWSGSFKADFPRIDDSPKGLLFDERRFGVQGVSPAHAKSHRV